MKITYKKGQAATEFLMTYGWAILAIVIVAAVLWNMGIFKSSCTATAPVQVFPAGSQGIWAATPRVPAAGEKETSGRQVYPERYSRRPSTHITPR